MKKDLALQIYELDRPFPKGKKKKSIELMKDGWGGQETVKETVGLKAKR